MTVGVLSDTHGHLYAEVKRHLQGVDHIVHAGDIGAPQILAELGTIAPVTAVRGNCDYDSWAERLPVHAVLELNGLRGAIGHVASHVQAWAEAAATTTRVPFDVVIFGHSHIPLLEWSQGVLHLNPGSAGPRRFNRPRSLARLTVWTAVGNDPGARPRIEAEIITID